MQTNTAITSNTGKTASSNLWLIIFAVVAVIGMICWGVQLGKGLQMTNLGVTNMWGLYIVGFMIFTGVAAGSLLFASVPYLFNLTGFKPYSKIASYLGAVSSIIAASLFIIVDIGNPERVWLFITSGNLSSPMFWDFIMLLAYMVISVIFTRMLILAAEGKADEKSLKPIALVAFIAGILVTVTSFVFCFQIARPMWNNPVQPLSFLIAALVLSLAVLVILASVLNKTGYIKMPVEMLTKMGRLMGILLCAELVIALAEVLVGLYPGSGEHYQAALWLAAGKGAPGFWLELITLLAAILLVLKKGPVKAQTLLAGAIIALIAIFLVKNNLLQAQLFNPLLTYPGPPMVGSVSGPYFPSLVEIGLSLGIIALGCLLLNLGLRILKLGE
ncbi:polysulfide reductase NrfD [Dehalobacter sp. DCM]|uniref:NrfD/PsrC family molybdoenzyme membrane anchor subunit n=1 Tax=Dehalobacter sp. DCM TaxID=2907827 RepID=UPI003081A9F5|nr:polysulfide reductase NrfD [Dehalobacter sp. DCM]